MTLTKKVSRMTILGSLIFGLEAKAQIPILYDNFDSGVLDSSKWEIRQDPEGQPLLEYNIHGGSFAAFQTQNLGDRRAVLSLKDHTFQVGETLEYDVLYVFGSGNRAATIFVNGGPLDRNNVGTIFYGGGSIGHNGQDFAAGNMTGQYHVRLSFQNDCLKVDIRRPSGEEYSEFFQNSTFDYAGQQYKIGDPYNMGFETWADGTIRMEYDNFAISQIPEPSLYGTIAGLTALGAGFLLRKNKAVPQQLNTCFL